MNQRLQQFIGVCFDGLTNLDKFHDVDTPFSAFVFGDERLRPTKAFGEFMLGKASGFARPDHQLAEGSLSCGMDRFVGFARASSHRRMGRTIRGVGQGLRELKEFYGLPENTLWVTIADGHFWWAFAKGPVVGVEPGNSYGPARYRLTKAGWSKTSLTGDPLTVRSGSRHHYHQILSQN